MSVLVSVHRKLASVQHDEWSDREESYEPGGAGSHEGPPQQMSFGRS